MVFVSELFFADTMKLKPDTAVKLFLFHYFSLSLTLFYSLLSSVLVYFVFPLQINETFANDKTIDMANAIFAKSDMN